MYVLYVFVSDMKKHHWDEKINANAVLAQDPVELVLVGGGGRCRR
jgi:hypothetical protein